MLNALDQEPRWPADPGRLSHLPNTLDELVGKKGRRVPDDVLIADEKAARARGILNYLWGRHHEGVVLNQRVWCRLSLLARRDWGQLAAAAETLPVRELREDLWSRLHIFEDREAILALLRSSAPVFKDGTWTGSTVALSMLENAVTHADQLRLRVQQSGWRTLTSEHAPYAELTRLEKEELPSWFGQVANVLQGRIDGRLLMLFFASWLVEEALRPGSAHNRWSSVGLVISAMAKLLQPSPTAREMKEGAQISLPKSVEDRRSAVALVTGAILGGDEKARWSEYRLLLLANDESLCWHARQWKKACCYDALAKVLDTLPQPFEEWMSAWSSIFVTDRERARFDLTSQNALLPSVHLVRVGVALLRRSPGRDGSRSFYPALRGHIRSLVENDARQVSPLADGFVTEALDVAPAVLGDMLSDALAVERPSLRTSKMQIYAVGTLLEGGARLEVIEAALEIQTFQLVEVVRAMESNGDLDNLIRPYCQLIRGAYEGRGPS
ncbi:hypothetical protein [Myxococcus eversor]|uniref:hypothetical protein n=1 Tax=Myxococcus eversor TaxID=2709661 RepID=UPI0013D4ED0D|nr:hypothetical protein [Myxococcus eversor]